jgi:hypothetical protein
MVTLGWGDPRLQGTLGEGNFSVVLLACFCPVEHWQVCNAPSQGLAPFLPSMGH